MSTLTDRIKKLKSGENRKIENVTETIQKIDRRKFNKGAPNSGRKPKEANIIARGIKAYLEAHYDEKVKIRVTDPKTGKVREISKPRGILALEQLFLLGMGQTSIGNADALNKWLDRALGRPAQVVRGDEDEPIMIKIDF